MARDRRGLTAEQRSEIARRIWAMRARMIGLSVGPAWRKDRLAGHVAHEVTRAVLANLRKASGGRRPTYVVR